MLRRVVNLNAISPLIVFLCLCEISMWPQSSPQASTITPLPRHALVIGMGTYKATRQPLRQAINDARAMKNILGNLGFQVVTVEDAPLERLTFKIEEFLNSLSKDDIAVIYYAGHGMQMDGINYFIPIDYDPQFADAKRQLYALSTLIAALGDKKTALNVFILDACRSNGDFSATTSTGLAKIDGIPDTLVAFAAAPGDIVKDDDRRANGIFTSELVKVLQEPGLTADEVFGQVRGAVVAQSGDTQRPSVSTNASVAFVFRDDAQTEYGKRIALAKLDENQARAREQAKRIAEFGQKQEVERLKAELELKELKAQHQRLVEESARRDREHEQLEDIRKKREADNEESRKKDLDRQQAEARAAVAALAVSTNTALDDHLTLLEARQKVKLAHEELSKRQTGILAQEKKEITAINARFTPRHEELSSVPSTQSMFETTAAFAKRRQTQEEALTDLDSERKSRTITALEYYKTQTQEQTQPLQDQIENLTNRRFAAEPAAAVWTSYDADRNALFVSTGPFLDRFDIPPEKAKDLYTRKEKLRMESMYRYYEAGEFPVRDNVVLVDPLGSRFQRSEPTPSGAERAQSRPAASGPQIAASNPYWTGKQFDAFEVAASKALESGAPLTFTLQHHHAMHDVHPVRMTVSRRSIAFEVIAAGLSKPGMDSPDTPPSSCNLEHLSTDIRNVAATDVKHNKEEEMFLTLNIREAGGMSGVRDLNFADESAHKEQWISKGMLGVGLVHRSIRSRPEAERALQAIRQTILRAVGQASFCPIGDCSGDASVKEARAVEEKEAAPKTEYTAQLIDIGHISHVVVQPTYKEDPSLLFIYFPETHRNEVIKLDQITKMSVEQRVLHLTLPSSNTLFEMKIGGPKDPKVYELKIETHGASGKKLVYYFISDSATCSLSSYTACQEGADGGQQVRDLAEAVQSGMAIHGRKQ